MGRFNIRGRFDLFQRETLYDKSFVEELAFPANHVLLDFRLVDRRAAHLYCWSEIEFLRNSIKISSWLILFAYCCQVYSWDHSYPDFSVANTFDKRNITVVRSAILDPDPLMLSQLIIFGLIILENDRHFFGWDQNELIQDEVETLTCLFNVDFLESFNVNVSFSCVTAGYRQDAQRLTDLFIVQVLVR
jgi:hypothetical protein